VTPTYVTQANVERITKQLHVAFTAGRRHLWNRANADK